jgi:hypothetical protein
VARNVGTFGDEATADWTTLRTRVPDALTSKRPLLPTAFKDKPVLISFPKLYTRMVGINGLWEASSAAAFASVGGRYQRVATAWHGWVAGAKKYEAEKRLLMGFYWGTPNPWT